MDLGLSDVTQFAVRRAGDWEGKLPPCDAARPAKIARYDRRTFQSEEEHDARFSHRPWRSEGREHDRWHDGRNGGIRRRIDDEDGWIVSVSAAQLVELSMLFGSVTIAPPQGPQQQPRLTLGWED